MSEDEKEELLKEIKEIIDKNINSFGSFIGKTREMFSLEHLFLKRNKDE